MGQENFLTPLPGKGKQQWVQEDRLLSKGSNPAKRRISIIKTNLNEGGTQLI